MSIQEEIHKRRTFGIISHPDAGKTTLTEKLLLFGGAIQEAGGIRPDANIREVEVRRLNKNGEVQIFKVDLWKLLRDGDLPQDVLLQEGDEIVEDV